MNKLKLYTAILVLFSLTSCTEFENDVTKIKNNSGSADFSTFIALGGSFTSGFQDGALFLSGQQNSFPAIIAEQMEVTEFTQPLMSDDFGGIAMAKLPNKLTLQITPNGLLPAPITTPSTTTLENIYKTQGSFFNFGIPGAHTAHLLAPNYGNPVGLTTTPVSANPYFVRFASSPTTTVLSDAMTQNPTFFSLWAGATDIIDIARKGCVQPFTQAHLFAQYYNMIVSKLTGNGAKGVVANIPNITQMPFFNTVPNNALKLNATQATQMTNFFKVITSIGLKTLIMQGVEPQTAIKLSQQYKITFKEGNNPFLLEVPRTPENPLGFRQMKPEELLLLSIDRNAMMTQGYGSIKITQEAAVILGKIAKGIAPSNEEIQTILAAIHPIKDKDALDLKELVTLNKITNAYNNIIQTTAKEHQLAIVDIEKLVDEIATKGIVKNGVKYNGTLVQGGFYSLDGIHPNNRGYAIIANHFIRAINTTYGSNLRTVDVNSYEGIKYP